MHNTSFLGSKYDSMIYADKQLRKRLKQIYRGELEVPMTKSSYKGTDESVSTTRVLEKRKLSIKH